MGVTFATVKRKFAQARLDHKANFTRNRNEHIRHIRDVPTLSNKVEIILELEKCQFPTETIDYLEQVISPRRLEIAATRQTKDAQFKNRPSSWSSNP